MKYSDQDLLNQQVKKLHVVEIRWMNCSLFSSVEQNENQEIMQLSKNESH